MMAPPALRLESGPCMNNWSLEMWRDMVDAAPEGIVVCDAKDRRSSGRSTRMPHSRRCAAIRSPRCSGTNLRMLQGADREQEARQRMREALSAVRRPAAMLMRNYRPDGTLFWNETVIQPVRDGAGRITHWVGYHRDASESTEERGERTSTGSAAVDARGSADGPAFASLFRGAFAARLAARAARLARDRPHAVRHR